MFFGWCYSRIKAFFCKGSAKSKTTYSLEHYNYVSRLPVYERSPVFFYLENHLEDILQKTIKQIEKYNVKPKIGIELEFYVLSSVKESLDTPPLQELQVFLTKNRIDFIAIEEERGFNQFEIKLKPYENMKKLIEDYNKLKSFLLQKDCISLKAIEKFGDAPSALQLNVSLVDNKGDNLFRRKKNDEGELEESELLIRFASSLVYTTNHYLYLYTKNDNCLQRYNEKINKIILESGKIPAPTYNAWGVNNRTASVRIPTPNLLGDIRQYELEDAKNRRVEFRVPSPLADLKLCLFGVLNNLLFALKDNSIILEKNNFNLLTSHHQLPKIQLEHLAFSDELAQKYLWYIFRHQE